MGQTDRSASEIQLLPRCDVCGVEYVEHYEGDCGEFIPSATDEQMAALDPIARCPGRVSWRATAEALWERERRRDVGRDYRVELFMNRDRAQDPRPTRAPGA